MDHLNHINQHFPVRRSAVQKQGFRDFVAAEAEKWGRRVQMDTLQGKHTNVVIGDLAQARVVFTAHYDTPASCLVPNLMLPRSPVLSILYHIGYPILLALFSLLVAALLKGLFLLDDRLYILLYLCIYFGVFYLCNRAFPNPHNKNDNTSGVAVLLSMMATIRSDQVAYIFFDNEEKGLLGSKACAKAYKDLFESKLVVNLDCVGVGEQVLTIAKAEAAKLPEYALLTAALSDSEPYCVHHFPAKGSQANSDFKSFPCGVGIMTCKRSKWLGFYTPNIHTNRDTVACTQNIKYLCASLGAFVAKL